jgi:hypothetical protein
VPGRSTGLPGEAPRGAIPTEILLPRTRRRATPAALIVGTGSLFAGLLFWLANRGALPLSPPGPPPSAPPVTVAPPSTLAGPLSRVDPDLRLAVERTLTAYAQALERGDASLLERARPDLTSAQREARIAPFRGALNATTDVRVLDARMDGERGTVQILASDVIVGAEPRPPVEETLRFERVDNGWRLVAERAAPARR